MGGKEGQEVSSQPKEGLVVIVMGSDTDENHALKIKETLNYFGVKSHLCVASAHKTPEDITSLTQEYDSKNDKTVLYIGVAGLQNALGGSTDFKTTRPAISFSIYDEKYGWPAVISALLMPKGIAAPVVIGPEAAALHMVKILALNNPELQAKLQTYQDDMKERTRQANREIQEKYNR